MGRKRRSKIITGSEYNFGAGGAASTATSTSTTGMVRIVRGATSNNNADFNGYVSPGDTIKVLLDQNVTMPTKNRYVLFDSPYEGTSGVISYSVVEGALPSGMDVTNDDDDVNNDWGTFQVYNTPSATGSVKYKVTYNDAYESFDIFYELVVAPAGTTPSWSSTSLPEKIIRNTAGRQTLASAVATSYATPTFSLKSVSGFTYGVTPAIDPATGEVYVENVGDINASETPHSFIVSVDIGEYGVFEQLFSGNMGYGDPYGAALFSGVNAKQNFTSEASYTSSADPTYRYGTAIFDFSKKSGALRRYYNTGQDTSPYESSDGYGSDFSTNPSTIQTPGVMGPVASSAIVYASGSNGAYVRLRWLAPAGVTSFCAVAVGGGGPGMYSWSADGGGGGGLAWINDVTCYPGEEFEIQWGLGRHYESSNSSYWAGASYIRRVNNAGYGASEPIIWAFGAGYYSHMSNPDPSNMTFTWNPQNNDNRDPGGAAASVRYGTYGAFYGAYNSGRPGSGAAGYRADGATGQNDWGRGGGGGTAHEYSSSYGNSGGGGVGLDGQGRGGQGAGADALPRLETHAGAGYAGSSGNETSYSSGSSNYLYSGGGGSGGSRGAYGENPWTSYGENGSNSYSHGGGMHGGGGGGSGTSYGGGSGSCGGVRIIWGIGEDGTPRSFPYTYCSERPNMKYNGEWT